MRLPSLQSPRSRAGPALMSGHLPWASFPHRGVNEQSPRARASQARFVPSSTFLTSSTAFSSAHLCGFVSPRSHVQGSLFRVFPSREAARARRPPLPSCRCPTPLPPVAREPSAPRPPSGPCSSRESVAARGGLDRVLLATLLSFVFPRVLLRAPCSDFHHRSDHGLSRPPSYRPCAT